jgi:hypothetical protein
MHSQRSCALHRAGDQERLVADAVDMLTEQKAAKIPKPSFAAWEIEKIHA